MVLALPNPGKGNGKVSFCPNSHKYYMPVQNKIVEK